MTRFVCVFLPDWPIERFLREKRKKSPRAQSGLAKIDTRPFALAASQAGGFRLTAVNGAAQVLGLLPGELLADARARVPKLRVRDADLLADREKLIALARWCGRFSPYVAPWPESEDGAPPLHGLTLDIAGCAHLFGGEASLCDTILQALKRLGITGRLALADTIGAAHALARHGPASPVVVPPGGQQEAIAGLPVAALRLSQTVISTLRRLGLKRIGDVTGLPRAALTQRFGASLVRRLEQALGEAAEPFSPLAPPIPYRAGAVLAEPITSQEHVLVLVERLTRDLAEILARAGKGARVLHLTLFRVDGETAELGLRLAQPTRDSLHVVKLFSLKLDALVDAYDSGFGFEAGRLDVVRAETIENTQNTLSPTQDRESRTHCLIDRLGSRLGVENVLRLYPYASHIPERAVVALPAAHHPQAQWEDVLPLKRPLLMLPCVEPAEVVALLPEGPPRQFRWRGVLYAVACAEGPERIRPEWWRGESAGAHERDYYVVEDEEGRRFWLYRDGPYGGGTPPNWYVHGVFA